MTILKAARRILSLVLAICLLAGVLPSLALADSTWKTRETPYGAKLKAGTVLYADEEMEQEAWILKEDALVRVTETRPKTAKVEFTVKSSRSPPGWTANCCSQWTLPRRQIWMRWSGTRTRRQRKSRKQFRNRNLKNRRKPTLSLSF